MIDIANLILVVGLGIVILLGMIMICVGCLIAYVKDYVIQEAEE